MYSINFCMKKSRYIVTSTVDYYKYKNGINIWNNRVYTKRIYGVYTYSFEDVLIFLKKELIMYFSKNNLLIKGIEDRKNELYQYYKNFRIYDLKEGVYIGEESHHFYHFYDLEFFKLFYYNSFSESTFIHTLKMYEIITEVAKWNGVPYKLSYLYPVLKIDEEYSPWGRCQHRKRFHIRSWNYLLLSKREAIAGSDPEYRKYLTMRQQRRDHCLNCAGYRKNRNNIPGDWKHYNKCRKQWAKNMDNPSYEKLSKAVWKRELLEEEDVFE